MKDQNLKIFYCNLGKAVNNREIGKRPIVLMGYTLDGKAQVCKITRRNKEFNTYVRMNPYLINGFCDVGTVYYINKNELGNYIRGCTTSEIKGIINARKKFLKKLA